MLEKNVYFSLDVAITVGTTSHHSDWFKEAVVAKVKVVKIFDLNVEWSVRSTQCKIKFVLQGSGKGLGDRAGGKV